MFSGQLLQELSEDRDAAVTALDKERRAAGEVWHYLDAINTMLFNGFGPQYLPALVPLPPDVMRAVEAVHARVQGLITTQPDIDSNADTPTHTAFMQVVKARRHEEDMRAVFRLGPRSQTLVNTQGWSHDDD